MFFRYLLEKKSRIIVSVGEGLGSGRVFSVFLRIDLRVRVGRRVGRLG